MPLDRSDVDTDQIIPADWLKRVERTGFGKGLFSDVARRPRASCSTTSSFAGASILVAGPNFGTGSSREHAVWAIKDYGFQAVISPPLRRHLPQQLHQERPRAGAGRPPRSASSCCAAVEADPTLELTIDVERRTLSAPGHRARGRRSRSTTPSASASSRASTTSASPCAHEDAITAFEATRPAWLAPARR